MFKKAKQKHNKLTFERLLDVNEVIQYLRQHCGRRVPANPSHQERLTACYRAERQAPISHQTLSFGFAEMGKEQSKIAGDVQSLQTSEDNSSSQLTNWMAATNRAIANKLFEIINFYEALVSDRDALAQPVKEALCDIFAKEYGNDSDRCAIFEVFTGEILSEQQLSRREALFQANVKNIKEHFGVFDAEQTDSHSQEKSGPTPRSGP